MIELEAGDLFACRWEAEPGRPGGFRIAEVVAVGPEELTAWFYGDVFPDLPEAVEVQKLRRVGLHDALGGGPIPVPGAQLATWGAIRVRRGAAGPADRS